MTYHKICREVDKVERQMAELEKKHAALVGGSRDAEILQKTQHFSLTGHEHAQGRRGEDEAAV